MDPQVPPMNDQDPPKELITEKVMDEYLTQIYDAIKNNNKHDMERIESEILKKYRSYSDMYYRQKNDSMKETIRRNSDNYHKNRQDNTIDYKAKTLLFGLAVENPIIDIEIIDLLLKHNASILAEDLFFVVYYGRLDILKSFIPKDTLRPNSQRYFWRDLYYSKNTEQDQNDVIQMLIEKKVLPPDFYAKVLTSEFYKLQGDEQQTILDKAFELYTKEMSAIQLARRMLKEYIDADNKDTEKIDTYVKIVQLLKHRIDKYKVDDNLIDTDVGKPEMQYLNDIVSEDKPAKPKSYMSGLNSINFLFKKPVDPNAVKKPVYTNPGGKKSTKKHKKSHQKKQTKKRGGKSTKKSRKSHRK
jgi:hypothetical protein